MQRLLDPLTHRRQFAVQVLPGLRDPELASEDPKLLADTHDLPSAALEQEPVARLQASRPGSKPGTRKPG